MQYSVRCHFYIMQVTGPSVIIAKNESFPDKQYQRSIIFLVVPKYIIIKITAYEKSEHR